MNKENFVLEIKKIGINLCETQLKQIEKYATLISKWNEKFNLTSITKIDDMYLKHFYDSLCLVKAIDIENIKNLCDVGSGAGFPGLVLAIAFPKLDVTLIEANGKKCEFLLEVGKDLSLSNVKVINDRAEQYSKKVREFYDIVTCRAVSHLRVLLEMCIPLIKVEGYFLPLKGEIDLEINESKSIFNELQCDVQNVIKYNLPYENSVRSIPIVKKNQITDKKYPREYNKIIKDLKNQ